VAAHIRSDVERKSIDIDDLNRAQTIQEVDPLRSDRQILGASNIPKSQNPPNTSFIPAEI
jgi:hypothetical protein